MRALRSQGPRVLVHLGSLFPLALLGRDYAQNQLTANPIQAATLRTGDAALILLVLALACTPASAVPWLRHAWRLRRAFGLYAFMYAALHGIIFVGLDYGFDLSLVWEEMAGKRHLLAGFAAFLLLIPPLLTSSARWRGRLGSRWKWVQRSTYAAAVLSVLHFLWLVKTDLRPPLMYGAVVVLLLLLRWPLARRAIKGATVAPVSSTPACRDGGGA